MRNGLHYDEKYHLIPENPSEIPMATFVKTKENFFLPCFSRYEMFQVEKMCEQEVKNSELRMFYR